MTSRPIKKTIWIVVHPNRVDRMTKSPPNTGRGELVVKLNLVIPPGAFQSPTVERTVEVVSALGGTELDDVRLTQDVITEEEAELIVQSRLRRMEEILRERGAQVSWPVPGAESEEPGHGYRGEGDGAS